MLNKLWPIFIIISISYAIFTGNIDSVNDSIFNSCKEAVDLTITFLGTMTLWSGIMEIIKNTTLINKLNYLLKPVMKILFPKIKKEDKEYKEISMNIISNILGLGNASTPLGIKAMKSMQDKNLKKDEITNEMMMFIVLNTASIQIIPTTILAIRSSLGSENPNLIIIPVWIVTIIAAFAGILMTKILIKFEKRGK